MDVLSVFCQVNDEGQLVEDLNSNGEDTEYDSMDLMVSWQDRSVGACAVVTAVHQPSFCMLIRSHAPTTLIPSSSLSSPFLPHTSQVGNTTDGGFGPGWIQDTGDDDL